MRTIAALLVAVTACGSKSSPAPSLAAAPELLQHVGLAPRGYASVPLTNSWIAPQLAQLADVLPAVTGKTLADCHIELAKLTSVRIAIGEPLRVAAELDGAIDIAAVTCMVGDAGIDALRTVGITLRDRPGGIALDYNVQQAAPTDAAAITKQCGPASCFAVRFGPPTRPLWIRGSLDRGVHIELDGSGMGAAGTAFRAAIDQLRTSAPALQAIKLDVRGDVLAFDAPATYDEQLSADLKEHVIEAFKIPSTSLEPTLHVGDYVYAVKGPLLGSVTPGDIFVYRTKDRDYVSRLIVAGKHRVTESEQGIAVDGTLLRREVVKEHTSYRDYDDATGEMVDRSASLIREHLGTRSYPTFRMGSPRGSGPWDVPEGSLFFISDNRNNAVDSRYHGPVPRDQLRGRVVVVWWASRDGAPDWDRIGTPVE